MVIGKIIKKGHYCRKRIANPKKFDRRSFRIKTVGKNTKVIVACPIGKFKSGRCRVGTKLQAILKKPKKSGICPRF